MINQETIIALATPNGLGAISVIRISGSNAISITEKVFKPKWNKTLHAAWFDSYFMFCLHKEVTKESMSNGYHILQSTKGVNTNKNGKSVPFSTHIQPLLPHYWVNQVLLTHFQA